MLFKTRDARNDNEIFYCELPRKFRFEITEREGHFQRYNSTLLAEVTSTAKLPVKVDNDVVVDDDKYATDNLFIQKGTKHLFYEQDGYAHHIFFLHNGWIIDKNNQTVETL